ncbi:MAG: porphobilinogen synthase [Fibrobacteraceae bacterium]|nr:porphobilinogen synthase [Fibrobacteraceae bacterium]
MSDFSYSLDLVHRPRRNRKSETVRDLVRETSLSVKDFVYPVFIMEGNCKEEKIPSMPGITRKSIDILLKEVEECVSLGVKAIAPFPSIENAKKDSTARESYNPDGLVPRAVAAVKKKFPDVVVMTDVALDPFNSDGHDGLVSNTGEILNDETVEVLSKMALCHAKAGADFVCPSDMMDGRIGVLRSDLDSAGFKNTSIMAYSAKYASAFYGPFRDALGSAPKAGDKKTYQMDPANRREALYEVALDIEEGADIVMVKPAGYYLDVIREVADFAEIPVAAYQVSGEYAMLVAAAETGWLDRDKVVLESLMGIKRAGAKMIWTYFAKDAARLLQSK